MKILKNAITVFIIMMLVIVAIGGNVDAAGMKASKSSVTVGQNVTVTVSFGEKVSAAQFKLGYDTGKFQYVSCSAGQLNNNSYAYLGQSNDPDLGSVTFTFKAKATGTGNFSLSGGNFKTASGRVKNVALSTSVKVEAAAQTTSKPTTTTKKPTTKKPTTKKPTTSQNDNDNTDTPEEPVVIEKPELDNLKTLIEGKVEGDYTEESWKALQDALAAAEGVATQEEYDALKEGLKAEILVPITFEKDELNNVLRDLVGKVEGDYTEDSWKELQDAITAAQNAELKSEYDAVKDKLNVNNLILEERGFIEGLMKSSCGHGKIIVILSAIIIVLLVIIIILGASLSKAKEAATIGRRIK